ncbi:Jacalin-related lectin 19, partial [Mucuna pruriens]
MKVEINASNLETFWYCVKNFFSIKLVGIHSFCLTYAKLYFVPKFEHRVVGYDNKICIMIKSLIERFNFRGCLIQNMIIHEDLKNITLPLFVAIIAPNGSIYNFSPKLNILKGMSTNNDPIAAYIMLLTTNIGVCFLKDVNFEDLNDMKLEDIRGNENKETSTWYMWLKSKYTTLECQMTNFKLVSEGKSRKKSVVVGPWGGNGGNSWDDGTLTGVREIKLVYDRCIDSIHVVYDKNGNPFTTEKHGGVGGNKTAEIKLQFPDEFLMSVSGHYCPVVRGGTPVIRSLTFKSNRKTFGPYGVEEGTPFTFSIDGCYVVGFKGRSDWYLDAIAFTLSTTQSKSLFQKVKRGLYNRLTSIAPKSSSSKDA